MNGYWRLISMMFISVFVLLACNNQDEHLNDNDPVQETEENEPQTDEENIDSSDEEIDETDDQMEENKDIDLAEDEDHYINGKVIMKEDENMIRIEAETNLIEGIRVKSRLNKGFGMLSSIGRSEERRVGKEGKERRGRG